MIPVTLVKHLMSINQINSKGEVTKIAPKSITDKSVYCPLALPKKIGYDVITSSGGIKHIKNSKINNATVVRTIIRNIVDCFVDKKTDELKGGGS
jgi:hypothetical protein